MSDTEKTNQTEAPELESNSTDSETVATKPVEPQAVQQPVHRVEQAPVTAVKSGGKGLRVVAILVSLIALGGTGYTFYKDEIVGRDSSAELAVDIAEIGGSVSRIGDTVSRLQTQQNTVVSKEQLTTRLLEANSAVDLRFRDVEQNQTDINNSLAKINSDLSSGVNDFIISEVAQLLKMANNSALFATDSDSAIKALQLADLQLKELADPRYAIVRRKINEEIGSLEKVRKVDVASLTVQLKSLASRIPALKLENDVPVLGEVVIEAEEEPTTTKGYFKEIWADLVNFNSVQRIDQPPKPLLVPEQRYFLNQNIQLQLAKAELGLVQNKTFVYSQSLDTATQWLNDYFDPRNDEVIDVLSQIKQLKAVKLGQELPNISGSYSALQSIRGGK